MLAALAVMLVRFDSVLLSRLGRFLKTRTASANGGELGNKNCRRYW